MPDRLGYFNGAWVKEEAVRVSAFDLSTMQGVAAFEMLRSFNKQHFKLPEHLARLRESCRLLLIPLPDDFERLPSIIEELTERNQDAFRADDEYRLLLVVSPGCAPMYREIAGTIPHSYTYATIFPLRYTVKGMGKWFTDGVDLTVSPFRQFGDSFPCQAKHRSRLHFHLAQMSAKGAWPLMLDPNDFVSELPGANLLLVKNNGLLIPDALALPGISQATAIEYCRRDATMSVERRPVRMTDVYAADEIWITGTPFCALPVRTIDGILRLVGNPGRFYRWLIAQWSKAVGVDIAGQIQRWDAEAGC